MMTITYAGRNSIYVNITNRCPCACVFCLRHNKDHVFNSNSLWLEREPTERLDELLQVASYIKSNRKTKIRINTNGLSDLINGEKTAHKLKGLIDSVSISLNATSKEEYFKTVRPKFGIDSYDAMLSFAKDCTAYVKEVVMTVVDVVTSKQEQEKSREICESIGATFRVRPYEEN